MKDFQQNMVKAWMDWCSGVIDAKALKSASSGFGIYQQRDDRAMMRVRRPGGIVTTDDFVSSADILDEFGGAYGHITTRQAIQLHGIPADKVPQALEKCESCGFKFRGGGGDTFRNTLVCANPGLYEDSAFDVLPYAKRLSEIFYAFDEAYALPRKLKIGFADRAAAADVAMIQDLGFVAKMQDGKRVFETYLAGGIGLKPRVGFKLFDALPAEDCARVAMALTLLFNERGCRTNRAHARIRFLREDFGDEGLKALFFEYYNRLADAPKMEESSLETLPPPVTTFPVVEAADAGFEMWREFAVEKLADGKAAVRILVPFGNFTPGEFRKFANVMNHYGATRFQIVNSQDLLLVVPNDQLAGVYNVLTTELGERDYVLKSYVGHIMTCIGCTVCKSGITDAPQIGKRLAEDLDKYLPPDTAEKMEIAKAVLNEVRISGCPNSCTCQQVVKFGFSGRKLNGVDAESLYSAGSRSPVTLGMMVPGSSLKPEELGGYLVKQITGLENIDNLI